MNRLILRYQTIAYNNYVFILVPTSIFKPTPEVPAFQFVGSIDRNGSADKASLKEGDYLIEVCHFNLNEDDWI